MQIGKASGGDWLRLSETADALGVSLSTLRRWSDIGRLNCYRSPGGHRRYRRDDVLALLATQSGVSTDLLPAPAVAAPPRGPSPVEEERGGGASEAGPTTPTAGSGARARAPRPGAPADVAGAGLEALLRELRRSLGAETCALYRVDDGVVSTVAAAGKVDRPGGPETWPLAASPAAYTALRERRAFTTQGPRGALSTMFAPIAEHPGLLEVTIRTERLPTAEPLIRLAATLLGPSLGHADTIAQLREHALDLESALRVALRDTGQLGGDGILRAIAQYLADLTAAPEVDIYAVEGETLRSVTSVVAGRFDEEWEGVLVPVQRYPCSRLAIESGEPVLIQDLDDPRLGEGGRYSLEKWGYRSQLSLPLLAGARVFGLLELSDYVPRDFGGFGDVAEALGRVAASALEVMWLQDQVDRRSRALGELATLGAIIGSPQDLEQVVRRVAARVLAAVDAANCDIFRADEAGLLCVASHDRSGPDERSVGSLMDPLSYPTVVGAANAQQLLVIASPDDPLLTEGERRVYRESGFASEVCVPLVANGRLQGLLDIYDTRERDYSEYLSFLKTAGQMLASAFANARLFTRLEDRATILREIVSLGELAAQTRDPTLLLNALAERLRDTIHAADCDIFALQGERLRCLVSADLNGLDEAGVGKVLVLERFPATAMAVRQREAVVIADLQDPRLTSEERAEMHGYGYESELCIPLVTEDKVIGLIDIFDTRSRDYSEYVDFLRSVGQIVAGALNRTLPPAAMAADSGPPTG